MSATVLIRNVSCSCLKLFNLKQDQTKYYVRQLVCFQLFCGAESDVLSPQTNFLKDFNKLLNNLERSNLLFFFLFLCRWPYYGRTRRGATCWPAPDSTSCLRTRRRAGPESTERWVKGHREGGGLLLLHGRIRQSYVYFSLSSYKPVCSTQQFILFIINHL